MYDTESFVFIIHVCFGVLIFLGNSLVIYLYFADRALRRKQTNRFVISLAFCDILLAIVFIPHEIFRESIQKIITVPIGGYVVSISVLGSLWNLVALTYDRYVAVYHGLRYEQIMKNKQVTKMMIGIWLSDIVITLLPLSWKFFISKKTDSFILHVYQFILVTVMIVVHVALFAVYVRIFITNRYHLSFSRDRSQMFGRQKLEPTVVDGQSKIPESFTANLFKRKKKPRRQRSDCLKDAQSTVAAEKNSIMLTNFKIPCHGLCETNRVDVMDVTDGCEMKSLEDNKSREGNSESKLSLESKYDDSSSQDCSVSERKTLRLRAGEALTRFSHSRAVCVELRAARVVLILFLVNTVCWIPTVTLNVVYLVSWLQEMPKIPLTLVDVSKYGLLLYSTINPWLYGILKADFKKAMKKHLFGR